MCVIGGGIYHLNHLTDLTLIISPSSIHDYETISILFDSSLLLPPLDLCPPYRKLSPRRDLIMAARMGPGGRPGGARFAQFKLVLLGALHIDALTVQADAF